MARPTRCLEHNSSEWNVEILVAFIMSACPAVLYAGITRINCTYANLWHEECRTAPVRTSACRWEPVRCRVYSSTGAFHPSHFYKIQSYITVFKLDSGNKNWEFIYSSMVCGKGNSADADSYRLLRVQDVQMKWAFNWSLIALIK